MPLLLFTDPRMFVRLFFQYVVEFVLLGLARSPPPSEPRSPRQDVPSETNRLSIPFLFSLLPTLLYPHSLFSTFIS
ncbi:hypothetical protein BDY24DRAFT_392456 [Mrakia frigida]|uniref:uncharacterized protein n=1 Tax=Mrakia frigida TaxID=29902 RepID=UPI003FCBFBFB